ncbi:MAG: CoA ester lyase [Novosphingobium sp.]|uniref:HpcH/HpaI aldolase/citrate lyase family protein n=1 Tax=Novosphingobium sp. TaxID=1874826 RepID=UPI00260CB031|nr:CoA ester lyase [Novosphingobium sp.]MCP5386392.1 CoA ester lyase [Novosphingobium sp.]
MTAYRPRRSALFLPASNAKAIDKARMLDADVVILDLEDAVAPEFKEEARVAAVAAVREGGFGRRELVIRANGIDTPWGREDLAAIAEAGPDAVLVPKIASPEDILQYNALISKAPAHSKLWVMIETCAAVARLDAIAACVGSTRLSAFVMGTNDLAKEMRARLRPGRAPFLPILSLTVAAARAHGLIVLDGVCNEFRDSSVLQAEAEQGLEWGFDGKSLIHPDQIGVTNAVFTPSADELAWAGAVVAAFGLPENAGKGAIRVEGKMAELLHLDLARRILAVAEAIG